MKYIQNSLPRGDDLGKQNQNVRYFICNLGSICYFIFSMFSSTANVYICYFSKIANKCSLSERLTSTIVLRASVIYSYFYQFNITDYDDSLLTPGVSELKFVLPFVTGKQMVHDTAKERKSSFCTEANQNALLDKFFNRIPPDHAGLKQLHRNAPEVNSSK